MLRLAAARADIHEICYLVLGYGSHIKKLVRVPNRANDTVMHHEFSSNDCARVRSRRAFRKLKCLGFLHTHVVSDAYPSQGDIKGYAPGTLIFIYSDPTNQIRAFRILDRGRGYIEKAVQVLQKSKEGSGSGTSL